MNDTLPPQVEAPHESRLKPTSRAHWRIWLAVVLIVAIIAGGIAWLVLRAPANTPVSKGRGGFDPNARPMPVVAAPAARQYRRLHRCARHRDAAQHGRRANAVTGAHELAFAGP